MLYVKLVENRIHPPALSCFFIARIYLLHYSNIIYFLGGDQDPKPPVRDELDSNVAYAQYRYPVEMVPIFECFLLKLEAVHKNVVQTNVTHGNQDMDTRMHLMSMINRQTPSILRNAIFAPSSYAYALEKTSLENEFSMEWFILLGKHARSFSTFSYKLFVKYREPVDQENASKSRTKVIIFISYTIYPMSP